MPALTEVDRIAGAAISDLLERRNRALIRQTDTLTTEEAAENSRAFHAADRAIVAELKRRNKPVRVGSVELHLTADRLHFAEVDPATGRAVHDHRNYKRTGSLLYRYPEARP